jgi:hypothetical protein
MRFLTAFKARHPKLFPVMTLAVALAGIGGIAAYERQANAADSCCFAGSPCCHPGAACCAGHRHASK